MEGPAPSNSPVIKPINKGVVHRICAGQVILDLSSAVKELVENSLDAGATTVEIALKEYGEEWFKVIDNGCGISPTNFKVVALRHHTSKLADFPDLESLTTFGFRGEALSSLCSLGILTIETRTKNEPVATHLTFDHSGVLIAEKKIARQIGTTVTVKKLFSNLPVRNKEFHRNIRKEYGKLISLLTAYALTAKGVRLVCSNTSGKNSKSVVLKTQGSCSLKDNIIQVLGVNTFSGLKPVSIGISDSCNIEGFISKSGQGCGRNLGDRQYFFVNGRPVDMPKVSKLVNEFYKGANSKQYPIAVMNFIIPTRECDVNVTPDKRKVFFSDESLILRSLREGLQEIYSSSNASYIINGVESTKEAESSEFCSSLEKYNSLLKKLPPAGVNLKLSTKEHSAEGDPSFTTVKINSQSLEFSEGFVSSDHENMSTLGVQGTNKIDGVIEANAGQLTSHMDGTLNKDFSEGPILRHHQGSLKKDFILQVHRTNKVNGSEPNNGGLTTHMNSISNKDSASSSTAIGKEIFISRDRKSHSSCVQSSLKEFVTISKRKHESISTVLSERPVLRNQNLHYQSKNSNSDMCALSSRDQVDDSYKLKENEPRKFIRANNILGEIGNPSSPSGGKPGENHENMVPYAGKELIDLFHKNPEDVPEKALTVPTLESLSSALVVDAPIPPSDKKICSILEFRFQDLLAKRQQRMSRVLHTSYRFLSMKKKRSMKRFNPSSEIVIQFLLVIGQFNLGFIIGKLDEDLFIVDQHAADEKYNFEHLAQSTILNQQPLLRPLKLELSPAEEVVASMHMDIIRKNGFVLEEDPDAPPGHHFKLRAVPFSKNITFGVEDVKDLISTLSDSQGECSIIGSYKMDTSDSVCPTRVHGMLASRACRSSVMIGDPLGRNEMQKILEHLADLKSPWNCPHGRPTMRHLIDLTTLRKEPDESSSREQMLATQALEMYNSALLGMATVSIGFGSILFLPLSVLKTAQGHPMLVELKNGETYNGHLVNCDTWMNIHLREVICTSKDGDRFWRMPECYIRGNTIKYLRVPDEVIDKVQEETKSRADICTQNRAPTYHNFNLEGVAEEEVEKMVLEGNQKDLGMDLKMAPRVQVDEAGVGQVERPVEAEVVAKVEVDVVLLYIGQHCYF
ncbi:DNA mismatch repair protein PMS1 [Hibiscus syriacus]|uniref:DNA mismatch repair protein PMS1 n=1 Tax=Hibiscus syriacus TaxID=106335 RepID=A0A6A2YAD5_HIBSY|nr:DNA mismatch repair protein PMS1 [Hibiscus syriacus]